MRAALRKASVLRKGNMMAIKGKDPIAISFMRFDVRFPAGPTAKMGRRRIWKFLKQMPSPRASRDKALPLFKEDAEEFAEFNEEFRGPSSRHFLA
jgi:hypothetical protein